MADVRPCGALTQLLRAGPSTRRKTSLRRAAAFRDRESPVASKVAARTVPRSRPALPSRGTPRSVVSLEEAQRSADRQFTRGRFDLLPWCLGGLSWDFRRRDQTGFWRVSKQLFALSGEVNGIEPFENANFQVIERSAPRETKTRGQGQ